MFELMVEETFDSAHALRGYDGPCENLHGHTWRAQIFLSGDKLNNIGILRDFRELRGVVGKTIKKYDHVCLNDLPEFKDENPSSENLSRNIFNALKKEIPELKKVTVWESATTNASYY